MLESTRIIIVEDEAIIAAEIALLLDRLGYKVVAKVMSSDKALDVLANTEADLAILDINIKGTRDGIDLAHIINEKYAMPFVFLTSYSDKDTLQRVKATMPYGYIVKPFNEHDLRSTIELALHKWASDQETFISLHQINDRYKIDLSERDYEVLQLLCAGKTYQEIADALYLSINTIKTYQKRLYSHLHVSSKAELINVFK